MAELDENLNADNVPLDQLHWQTLKKMVEEKGGAYESKEKAIAFLSAEETADPGQTTTVAEAADTPVATPPDAPADTPAEEPAAVVAKIFDPNRPYGEISGTFDDAPGARFMQNGLYYDSTHAVVGKV